jgi:hypothetical protein
MLNGLLSKDAAIMISKSMNRVLLRIAVIAVCSCFFLSSSLFGAESKETVLNLQLGSPVNAEEAIPIQKIIINSDDYVNKTITTHGTISADSEDGTWVHLIDSEKVLVVFAQSPNWIFPAALKGSHATVKGLLVKKTLKDNDLEKFIAEHKSLVKKTNHPDGFTFYEIEAAGAEIKN